MSNDREFEAINAMAMEQIAQLERGGELKEPPQISQRGDFWKSEYGTSRYRPSTQGEVSLPLVSRTTPRSYYTSSRYDTGAGNPEYLYRKMAMAVYRQDDEVQNLEKGADCIILEDPFRLNVGSSLFDKYITKQTYEEMAVTGGTPVVKLNRSIKIPDDTRNQFLAMLLSSISRMLTMLVLTWAKSKRVPYELL